jgi:hypothetical protein
MNAKDSLMVATLQKTRSLKVSVMMLCSATIASQAFQGNLQVTIYLAPLTTETFNPLPEAMAELTKLGYTVHKTGNTRLYVSWEDAK